jgi:3-oxoacyl-[acyl-carrier-protein] synthase-3
VRSGITGVGHHVPERVVANADLEKLMDTSDAWIVERTGIHERRFVEPGTGTTDLAAAAARRALEDAGRATGDVDFVIFATITRDLMFPGCAPLLQDALGLGTVGTLEVHNACSGFIYSVSVADAMIRAGACRCALVIGAEVQSTGLDFTTGGRDMAVLFGDGAGAVVMEPVEEDGRGVLSFALHSEGAHARDLWAEAPTSTVMGRLTPEMLAAGAMFPRMNGRQVFKHATTRFPEVILESLEKAGERLEDAKLVIPHQANKRIGDAIAERLGIPPEKVFQNIQRYGNTTAASVPIALSEARAAGLIERGDLVVLAAFGAGFAWGAVTLRW